jgi:hypothetical protein
VGRHGQERRAPLSFKLTHYPSTALDDLATFYELAMERGLLVEVSRNEESALRRISVGIDQRCAPAMWLD